VTALACMHADAVLRCSSYNLNDLAVQVEADLKAHIRFFAFLHWRGGLLVQIGLLPSRQAPSGYLEDAATEQHTEQTPGA
jgi:hypothetical protein